MPMKTNPKPPPVPPQGPGWNPSMVSKNLSVFVHVYPPPGSAIKNENMCRAEVWDNKETSHGTWSFLKGIYMGCYGISMTWDRSQGMGDVWPPKTLQNDRFWAILIGDGHFAGGALWQAPRSGWRGSWGEGG